MTGDQPTAQPSERCAHCGDVATVPVSGIVRAAVLVYCSAGCRDDQLAVLALDSRTCESPGCDRDRAADVPFCDEHLDPATPGAGRDHRAA